MTVLILVFLGFQLHTERLAQERDDCRWQKEEQDSRQYLKSQQKLLGKKKTEEFARMRLIRPQDRTTRQRNLHQNGKPVSPKAAQEQVDAKQQRHLETQATRPMLSARERVKEDPSSPSAAQCRPRPQSAKSVLQTHAQSGITSRTNEIVSGTKISVRRLENCGYTPMPLTSHLLASQSAAQLRMPRHQLHHKVALAAVDADQSCKRAANGTTSGKQRIVVYMQRLELSDSDDDDDDDDELVQVEHKQLERSYGKADARKSVWAE